MTNKKYFQDAIPQNHCYGCGPGNDLGLQIKSYWTGDDQSACVFTPSSQHCAASKKYLNGGIIATVIDCHCICTAMAKGYALEDRAVGEGDLICYVTGALNLSYKKPTPIETELLITAKITEVSERKILLTAELYAGDVLCVIADLTAVKVPPQWLD
ncbi:MAG: PaaI family thioesterase [Lentisphaeria bacterium]|nr:PaaI family thioesterase [Lentisphaeria bacterium]